jgi:hypothetical protein
MTCWRRNSTDHLTAPRLFPTLPGTAALCGCAEQVGSERSHGDRQHDQRKLLPHSPGPRSSAYLRSDDWRC